jgi:hypothetical protein
VSLLPGAFGIFPRQPSGVSRSSDHASSMPSTSSQVRVPSERAVSVLESAAAPLSNRTAEQPVPALNQCPFSQPHRGATTTSSTLVQSTQSDKDSISILVL